MGSDNSGDSNTARFTIFDYLGLGFILAPEDSVSSALVDGRPFEFQMLIQAIPMWLIGAFFIYAGRNWPSKKIIFPSILVRMVDRVSKGYLIPFSVLFVMLLMAPYSPLILNPLFGRIFDHSTQNAPSSPPMSDDEKQFRFDLRAFVLSDLQGQANAFGQLTALSYQDLNPNLYNKIETQRLAAAELLQPDLKPYYAIWDSLSADVNMPIDQIDLRKTSKDLLAYFSAFSNATEYFKDYLILSQTDPNQSPNVNSPSPLGVLISADNKAVDTFNNLVTSPIAKAVGITPSGWFWASQTFKSFVVANAGNK